MKSMAHRSLGRTTGTRVCRTVAARLELQSFLDVQAMYFWWLIRSHRGGGGRATASPRSSAGRWPTHTGPVGSRHRSVSRTDSGSWRGESRGRDTRRLLIRTPAAPKRTPTGEACGVEHREARRIARIKRTNGIRPKHARPFCATISRCMRPSSPRMRSTGTDGAQSGLGFGHQFAVASSIGAEG